MGRSSSSSSGGVSRPSVARCSRAAAVALPCPRAQRAPCASPWLWTAPALVPAPVPRRLRLLPLALPPTPCAQRPHEPTHPSRTGALSPPTRPAAVAQSAAARSRWARAAMVAVRRLSRTPATSALSVGAAGRAPSSPGDGSRRTGDFGPVTPQPTTIGPWGGGGGRGGSVAHPERVTQPGVVQGDPAAGGQVVSCCIHDDSFLQAASPCRRRAAFDQGR